MGANAKVVKTPGGRVQGPRPKIDHPGKLFGRLMSYVFQNYAVQCAVVLVCGMLSRRNYKGVVK